MENSKAETATPVDGRCSVDARFLELANGSSLDEGVAMKAADLYKEFLSAGSVSVSGSGSGEKKELYWMLSALYCTAKLGGQKDLMERRDGNKGFILSQLLKAGKVNASGFFEGIPQFLLRADDALRRLYGPDWEEKLEVKDTKKNFEHMMILSNHYRCAFEEVFMSNDTSNGNCSSQSSSSINPAFVSKYYQFGWLLFLAFRSHALGSFRDMGACNNVLVAIVAILILHVPIRFRKCHILDSARLVKRSDKGMELLPSLCDIYPTSLDYLKVAMDKVNNLIVHVLRKKPCPASDCRADSLAGINTAGLVYFDGLMEDSSLLSSLKMLEQYYVDATCPTEVLDERIFANEGDNLIDSGRFASKTNGSSSKHNFDSTLPPLKTVRKELFPPCSPTSRAKGKFTWNTSVNQFPVSTAMTTSKWLHTVISPLPSEPTKELQLFLSSCDRDITVEVLNRANIILDAIFPCNTSGDRSMTGALPSLYQIDQAWMEERKVESAKLYYKVLEAICRSESKILNGSNLTPLLSNERFHRCMLSCSAELILASHKTATIMFPAILERTGITAFDLCKVIESFVRHEESLPRELKRHLNSLEERLLESMVWEKGSSMYNSLTIARPALSKVINEMGLLAEPMPSLDIIASNQSESRWSSARNNVYKPENYPDRVWDIHSPKRLCTGVRNVPAEHTTFTSPVKDRLMGVSNQKMGSLPLQSAFATPTRQNPSRGGETCAETDTSIFYSKIIKLAANRIKGLCEKLKLSSQILDHIYCLFQQILNQRTLLFFNRHIDQLILCCIYGVAKIFQLNLTFKDIINGYIKQPHFNSRVWRSVFVDRSRVIHDEKFGVVHVEHVDIITFYNEVVVPLVKPLFKEIRSSASNLGNQPIQDGNNANRDGPGSPNLSPFPRLPDMSPKKVSATHNVYVSPLTQSKMDALLSPSSKSLYACIGESSDANDLNIINKHLNRRAELNFGFISDSVVAGVLGHQNGNSEPASPRTTSPDQNPNCDQNDAYN